MILITSAAYVDQDLSAEVGLIPPSFLPVGNQRLYEHQISLFLNEEDDIYLSLPSSFNLNESDLSRINALGANVLFVPDNVSLGESILYSWNATGKTYNNLKILHGDTLFLDIDLQGENFVSASMNRGAYHRAAVESNTQENLITLKQGWVNDSRSVLSGFFNFANPQLLMKCIVESKNDFIQSLVSYSSTSPLHCRSFNKWLDFGHLNSFFASRTAMTTQRVFNDLQIIKRGVVKQSRDLLKMKAESHWFESLPSDLRIYTPALLQPYIEKESAACYSIEYLYLLPLSDLFVFGNHSVETWKQIFLAARDILNAFSDAKNRVFEEVSTSSFNKLYLSKTLSRLAEYKKQSGVDVSVLIKMANDSLRFISSASENYISIIHGDFCFSNLLYDSRTQSLKLIDPRGLDADRKLTLLGDKRYDLAKLFHSAVGCYDLIIAGRYKVLDSKIEFYDQTYLDMVEQAFIDVFSDQDSLITKHELLAINIHLFLSMLPLHRDSVDRQNAMVLNAKRLFNKLNELDSL